MRLFAAFILLSISLNASAQQSINEMIASGGNVLDAFQATEAIKRQQLQNEMARLQLQQMQQQQQSVERNSENEGLERELLELQIQQERLKLAKLQNGETQRNHVQSSDLYVSLTSEQVTGESKICLYSYDSALYDFTVPSGDKCPSSIMIRK